MAVKVYLICMFLGAITMALLENLVAGNVYIVKISASNEVGEGPFSNSVELVVLPKDTSESNQRPKRLDSSDAKGLGAATVTGFHPLILQLSQLPHPRLRAWFAELLPVGFRVFWAAWLSSVVLEGRGKITSE